MSVLQCDYAVAGRRALAELERRRVHPHAVGLLIALPVVLFVALLVALFAAFKGPRGLSGVALLEGMAVIALTGLALAFLNDRVARRAARSALATLSRAAPLCSFESPSDGFVFFSERGFFREESLSFKRYRAAGAGVTDVRYDASARCLRLRGSEPSQRGLSRPFRIEIELPRTAARESIVDSVAVIAAVLASEKEQA